MAPVLGLPSKMSPSAPPLFRTSSSCSGNRSLGKPYTAGSCSTVTVPYRLPSRWWISPTVPATCRSKPVMYWGTSGELATASPPIAPLVTRSRRSPPTRKLGVWSDAEVAMAWNAPVASPVRIAPA